MFTVVKPHPVLAPVLAATDHFEGAVKQRVERMGDPKMCFLTIAMRRI